MTISTKLWFKVSLMKNYHTWDLTTSVQYNLINYGPYLIQVNGFAVYIKIICVSAVKTGLHRLLRPHIRFWRASLLIRPGSHEAVVSASWLMQNWSVTWEAHLNCYAVSRLWKDRVIFWRNSRKKKYVWTKLSLNHIHLTREPFDLYLKCWKCRFQSVRGPHKQHV